MCYNTIIYNSAIKTREGIDLIGIKNLSAFIPDSDNLDFGIIITDTAGKIQLANEFAKSKFYTIAKSDPADPQEKHLLSEVMAAEGFTALGSGSDALILRQVHMHFTDEDHLAYLVYGVDDLISKFPEASLYNYARREIQSIIDCIQDGIYITDGDGITLMINEASKKYCDGLQMPFDEMIGKNVSEFVERGYWDESISMKVLQEKKTVSQMQTLQNKIELLTTGVPYFENGKISKVITTEREMTELVNLRKQLQVNASITKKYESELEYYRSQNTAVDDIIHSSAGMQNVVNDALKAARQDVTILLQGESGTGKEVLASLIVKGSARKNKPYIKINCASIPENLLESELFGYEKGSFTGAGSEGKIGIFELANNGTLFLDEIAEIPIHIQSKLLRAIQESEILRVGGRKNIPINVRIIAATNINLRKAVEDGRFRGDLFYRLNIFPITLPPLRARKEDIQGLVLFFMDLFNKKYRGHKTIDPNAMDAFLNYDWPGNVRELKNVIERMFIIVDSDTINKGHVNSQLFTDPMRYETEFADDSLIEQVDKFEKSLLKNALTQFGTVSASARALKISKSAMSKKCKKYNIPIQR